MTGYIRIGRPLRCMLMAFLLGAAPGMAGAAVRWLEREYDFGLMKEAAGPKTGVARFVNDGPESVTVIEAKPSCGCTDSSWPEDPVAPGDTAAVTFTYDPAGRPGRFEKSVKVKFADGRRETIRIRGNVLGTPESLDMFYPVKAGALRLSESVVNVGRVTRGKTPTQFVNAYNQLADSVTPYVRSGSHALKADLSEKKAGPGDIIAIGLYFDSKAWGTPGPFEIPVELISDTSDPAAEAVTLTVKGEVVPERRVLGASELAKAPVCVAVPPVVDLGEIGDVAAEGFFTVLNDGRSPLVLERVWSADSRISIGDVPGKLKSGKNGRIDFTLDPSTLPSGPFRMEINIATDDPVNPVTTVRVTGAR